VKSRLFLISLWINLCLSATALAVGPICNPLAIAIDKKVAFSQLSQAFGLHYVDKIGQTFELSQPIADENTLKRIEQLKIPPGWKHVKIAVDPLSHVQVKGIDSKGRTQYLYHELWNQVRDAVKFNHMSAFGGAVVDIRNHTAQDIQLTGLPKRKILAAAVQLLELTAIRVGNEEYTVQNSSYGLTTMLKTHVRIEDDTIFFSFMGKSHVFHEDKFTVEQPLLGVLTELMNLPGNGFLQYVDEKGVPHAIDSTSVNKYLKETAAGSFSAKDFRTWLATVYAAEFLFHAEQPFGPEETEEVIQKAIAYASDKLGNSPTVCRDSYIQPVIFNLYRQGQPFNAAFSQAGQKLEKASTGRSLAEEAVLLMAP
jgi:DNA topoisomerase-1